MTSMTLGRAVRGPVRFARLAAVLCACGLSVGCGGSGDSRPKFPASGTVTLEGAPVEGAVVAFVLEGGGATAVAMTDEMGQFKLNVPPGKNGVPAGKYQVSVRKSESAAPTFKEPTTFEEMEKQHKAGIKAPPPPPPKKGVPEKYGDAATSGLSQEVVPGKPNEFKLELKG